MSAKPFLVASIGLNLLLAGLLLRSVRPPGGGSDGLGRSAARSADATGQVVRSESAQASVVTNTIVRKITWEQVESPDYREYIRNLRSIGCPDETIRDIILADVNKLYDAKRKQIRGGSRKFEYWKAGNPMIGVVGDPEMQKKMRALEEEKTKVLLDLGIQPDAMTQLLAAAGGNPMEVMFDFLPEAKRTEVTKLMTEFQSKMMEAAGDGAMDAEAMMKAQRGMEDAIQKMLTPEEFRDYQLRFSMTANTLRQQIAGFDPTEEEFLKVFELREAHDREFSPFANPSPTEEEQRKMAEAQSALSNKIKEALGESRFEDYTRAQDYGYQQLYRAVKKADLPPTVANDVYGMKQIAERQAVTIQSDSNLTADQRSAALQAVRAETVRSMEQTLGPTAWEQYNRPNNMWWLRNIAPDAPPAPPSP